MIHPDKIQRKPNHLVQMLVKYAEIVRRNVSNDCEVLGQKKLLTVKRLFPAVRSTLYYTVYYTIAMLLVPGFESFSDFEAKELINHRAFGDEVRVTAEEEEHRSILWKSDPYDRNIAGERSRIEQVWWIAGKSWPNSGHNAKIFRIPYPIEWRTSFSMTLVFEIFSKQSAVANGHINSFRPLFQRAVYSVSWQSKRITEWTNRWWINCKRDELLNGWTAREMNL